jgi:hypothetical protein
MKSELEQTKEKLFLACGIDPRYVGHPLNSQEGVQEPDLAKLSPVLWYGASRVQ